MGSVRSSLSSSSSRSSVGGHATGTRVGLFVTCLVDLYRPNVGFASISLLEQAGCTVSVPESQTCCGQPAFNSGETANSKKIAKATIEAFESFDYIVAPSGSCAGMLREHYPELLEDEADWFKRATEFSSRVYELTSFLVDVLEVEAIDAKFPHSVTYHDSCSGLREMGIKSQPRQLLAQVEGLSLNEMADTEVCCGFGGTFCVKYPDISERLVSDKVALARKSQAQVLLAGDMGCLLNISGRLKRTAASAHLSEPGSKPSESSSAADPEMRVYHVAEVLAGMAEVAGIGDPDKAPS